MKKSNLLTTAAAVMLLTATAATAQTCIKTPSCADLGYTKTAADCSGKTILKCPLDNTQVYCPGYEETLRTYKVGDTYVDANGAGVGTVVQVDSSGKHGIMVVSAGTGTYKEISTYCQNLLGHSKFLWQPATPGVLQVMNNLGRTFFDGCQSYHSTGGYCHLCGSGIGSCNSSTTDVAGGFCQAPF